MAYFRVTLPMELPVSKHYKIMFSVASNATLKPQGTLVKKKV